MLKYTRYILFFAGVSCVSPKIITTNLQNLTTFENSAQIYSLPKTRIIISAEAVRHSFQPGPYAAYAKKFLGIENAGSVEGETWEIMNIEVFTTSEPDPEHYYSVKSDYPAYVNEKFLELSASGLVVAPQLLGSFQNKNSNLINQVPEINTTDLSIKQFVFDKNKKKQKNLLKQSDSENVPMLERHLAPKSIEEKAFEAANFIFKIRKRRFKLLAGQYEVFPEGIALEASVAELNELEEKYLSLFTGTRISDTIKNIFTFSPDDGINLQRSTLFYFSESEGFRATEAAKSNPVILEVQDLGSNDNLNQLQLPYSGSSFKNILFVRLPDRARAKVLYGSHEVVVSEFPVYQFGPLVPFSVQLPKNPDKRK